MKCQQGDVVGSKKDDWGKKMMIQTLEHKVTLLARSFLPSLFITHMIWPHDEIMSSLPDVWLHLVVDGVSCHHSWLTVPLPLDSLLWYPTPRGGIPNLTSCVCDCSTTVPSVPIGTLQEILITNYTSTAHNYYKCFIMLVGAMFTPRMI